MPADYEIDLSIERVCKSHCWIYFTKLYCNDYVMCVKFINIDLKHLIVFKLYSYSYLNKDMFQYRLFITAGEEFSINIFVVNTGFIQVIPG